MNFNLEEDFRVSSKNIQYLKDCVNRIDEASREDLSSITKDIGNKIIFLYDNLADGINQQRSLNLFLQTELVNLQMDNNTLSHEIKNLTIKIKKMETFLGVETDLKFDSLISQNIFK